MNIFVVSETFERPVSTVNAPVQFQTLRAEECATCHRDAYDEWRTTIHSQAWTDPYFQVDWEFDRSQQICKNCHIPLDRQQEHKVTGFRDKDKWEPILVPNPEFDPLLQHEGVTCTVCHLRDGEIIGVLGVNNAPHPIRKIDDPNQVCVRCHVVEGDRWDTFFRFPPCGTVAEIQSNPSSRLTRDDRERPAGETGEVTVSDVSTLGCVQCHMPLVKRPLVEGGEVRSARQHLWRGGHDPEMVKKGLEVRFEEVSAESPDKRAFVVTLTNVGAAHYLPTGTPDRHLTVNLRLRDTQGNVVKEEKYTLKRTVMWRPFIIDLQDTRLPRWQPRTYQFSFSMNGTQNLASMDAVVRYHLLAEKRRKRIGYENREPISYEVFRKSIPLVVSKREGA